MMADAAPRMDPVTVLGLALRGLRATLPLRSVNLGLARTEVGVWNSLASSIALVQMGPLGNSVRTKAAAWTKEEWGIAVSAVRDSPASNVKSTLTSALWTFRPVRTEEPALMKRFEGIYCENNKDDCFRVSCPEGKVCIDGINSYECGCPPGFTGDACTENINVTQGHLGTRVLPCTNLLHPLKWTRTLRPTCPSETLLLNLLTLSFDELCNQGICINEAGTYQCFCRPGFSGDHCDKEFDECLSYPCQNGATCVNEINAYHCHCAPGFTGQDCEFNIDECLSEPCQNGGSCVDGIASFNCSCVPGFTGLQCEVNIDECALLTESAECLNGGTCIDGIKDYECACHPAYSGKNCEVDIPECDSQPCANGGACYERSNVSLYSTNQFGYRFLVAFSYETAAGYACDCLPGFTGDNCEINIDECSSNPCLNGNCVDQVNAFFCECFRGYEGMLCQVEINECERFTPCVRGTCEDKIGDYVCSCPPNYGGKNCSVALTGCNGVTCSNGGSCFPYVKADEVTHGFTCVCPPGFTGFKCEIQTTVQFNNNGYLYLRTGVTSGYRLTMRFRTTLPNSLLAMSQGPNSAVFTLSLSEGRVHLNSSLLNMLEGIAVGESLNSGDWQECGLSFNASHATLSVASLGADGERQNVSQVVPINPNVEDTSSGVPQAPVFQLTVVGGKPRSFTYWAQSPSLIGCLQDINLNGDLFLPSELDGTVSGVSAGCDRQEQCEPNPCQNRGTCDDMWTSFQCQCPRPFLGRVCTKSFTEATFGHENTTSSLVSVRIPDRLRTILRTDLDISFFLRTREPDAFLLYIGTQLGNALFNDSSHLILRLDDGRLLARVQLSEVETKVFAHGDQLNTGHQQLIRVVRHNERLSISVNGSVLSNTSIPVTRPLEAEIMHLGNMPSSSRRVKRQVVSVSAPPLKGTLQDVRLGSDGEFFEVEFFGLDDDVRPPPDLTLLRRDVVTVVDVLRGSIQDNTCRHDPCVNGGSCRVKWWNDFECTCPELFHGKTCSLIKYCSLDNATTCPSDGECRDLITGGFECVTDATFVDQNTTLTYQLRGRPDDSEPEIRGRFRTKVGGPILSVGSDLVVEARRSGLRLRLASSETFPIPGNALDGQWHDFVIKLEYALSSTNRTLTYIHGSLDDPSDEAQPPRIGQSYAFNLTRSLAQTGGILQVGVAPIPESGSNYLVNQNDRSPSLAQHDVEIHGLTGHHNDVHYRGCIGELRIFDLLLPFFDSIEMGENQLEAEFLVQGPLPIRGQCRLCFDSECQHNSSCLSPLSSYNCSCQKGYEGQFCEIDIDECSLGHQCLNGDCVDGISTYTCACHPGFTGTRCETDINECESQPCQHGGSCIDQINDFKCSCTPDWEGHTCEDLKLKNCSQNPCLNNGRCQDIKYGSIAVNFTCVCSKAFTGRRCETQINFCDSYPCRNSAECIPRMGDFDCVCPLGYTGKQCEIDIDECASQPCHNGGTCSEGIDVFTCQCPPEWTGLTCSDDVDECLSDICENGGTCSNTEGGFNCECPEGYCGPHCSHYDPCLQNDLENQNNVSICLNEGECIPLCREEDPIQNATYLCNCTEGWEGEFCHIEATPSSQTFNKLVIIVAPILAAILVIAGISLMIFFIAMARKKRATRGTYSPSRQEIFGSRVEMGNVLKPPPEERLI
ncbi:unnamed protein product [Cyprideis torosa]|uniref:Uncharacterized protein n=1 Tax=Cyprideis torosa TaxID=163714 RepID=A0A7R8WE23_9CRUS|nr:unnamed protein product [Cyprideis torosa]CAG0888949.1 unnamed protein product [Cyprideis torosa]